MNFTPSKQIDRKTFIRSQILVGIKTRQRSDPQIHFDEKDPFFAELENFTVETIQTPNNNRKSPTKNDDSYGLSGLETADSLSRDSGTNSPVRKSQKPIISISSQGKSLKATWGLGQKLVPIIMRKESSIPEEGGRQTKRETPRAIMDSPPRRKKTKRVTFADFVESSSDQDSPKSKQKEEKATPPQQKITPPQQEDYGWGDIPRNTEDLKIQIQLEDKRLPPAVTVMSPRQKDFLPPLEQTSKEASSPRKKRNQESPEKKVIKLQINEKVNPQNLCLPTIASPQSKKTGASASGLPFVGVGQLESQPQTKEVFFSFGGVRRKVIVHDESPGSDRQYNRGFQFNIDRKFSQDRSPNTDNSQNSESYSPKYRRETVGTLNFSESEENSGKVFERGQKVPSLSIFSPGYGFEYKN